MLAGKCKFVERNKAAGIPFGSLLPYFFLTYMPYSCCAAPSYAIGHSLIRYMSLILSLYAPGLENLFLGIIDFLEFLLCGLAHILSKRGNLVGVVL